jgi:hypothetical protein
MVNSFASHLKYFLPLLLGSCPDQLGASLTPSINLFVSSAHIAASFFAQAWALSMILFAA